MDVNEIILPRRDENGDYRISYSQLSAWNVKTGFNLKTFGTIEYMSTYFFGDTYPDAGWGEFGHHVEGYITERQFAETFTESEKKTMEAITPLGVFQYEVKLYILPNVYILGYIDDMLPDKSKIRDYKTASLNSKSKYYKDTYYQLDIYGMFIQQLTGKIPDAEVCIIERKGNVMGMVNARNKLSVGDSVWYCERKLTEERLELVRQKLIKFVHEVSEHYKLYLKLNGKRF